jgi:hypothetical protein
MRPKWSAGPTVLSTLFLSLAAFGFATALQAQSDLKIAVVEGSGAQTIVSRRAPRPITLRIFDSGNQPIAGATVVLTAPKSGPSGTFLNGSNSIIVFTNQQGLAVVQDYRANSAAGSYQIQVQAAYMGDVATISIDQTNFAAKKSANKFILIAGAAGAAVAAVLATKGGNESPPTDAIPGGPTVPTIVLLGSSVRGAR